MPMNLLWLQPSLRVMIRTWVFTPHRRVDDSPSPVSRGASGLATIETRGIGVSPAGFGNLCGKRRPASQQEMLQSEEAISLANLEWVVLSRIIDHPWVYAQECVISRAHGRPIRPALLIVRPAGRDITKTAFETVISSETSRLYRTIRTRFPSPTRSMTPPLFT